MFEVDWQLSEGRVVGGLDEGIKQKSYMCVYMYKRQPCGDRGKVGGGLVEVGKGGGDGDRRRLWLGQWVPDTGCRWYFVELYIWNLYGLWNIIPINSIKNNFYIYAFVCMCCVCEFALVPMCPLRDYICVHTYYICVIYTHVHYTCRNTYAHYVVQIHIY